MRAYSKLLETHAILFGEEDGTELLILQKLHHKILDMEQYGVLGKRRCIIVANSYDSPVGSVVNGNFRVWQSGNTMIVYLLDRDEFDGVSNKARLVREVISSFVRYIPDEDPLIDTAKYYFEDEEDIKSTLLTVDPRKEYRVHEAFYPAMRTELHRDITIFTATHSVGYLASTKISSLKDMKDSMIRKLVEGIFTDPDYFVHWEEERDMRGGTTLVAKLGVQRIK